MEPGVFFAIPVSVLFFWLSWVCLKQLKHNIKSGGFQLQHDDSGRSEVTYIKRDKNPIVFHFFNSFICLFGSAIFFAATVKTT
ncbi:MAG: hypothetical protein QGH62_06480 [Nitrospinaceae bacterium]|jgi:hypothetical protein|nr:hypothetical protein [Nitrospinaceae bacterium]